MALQVCPRCGKRSFTWYDDPDESRFTIWHCSACGYHPEEDEAQERTCPHCGTEHGYSLFFDQQERYWYCVFCLKKAPADGVG
jgi:transposase